ncbi:MULTISPECIES: hypothetical protein [Levilactobacillus]|uniref:Uncharacterized protein n=1 Tax=Levilactobacillus fuyuanensis TaxID=2486022 RepID=A0ABW4H3E7_9LACO|nr:MULTISPECIES: hypothetical protein [Levilactobacillus]
MKLVDGPHLTLRLERTPRRGKYEAGIGLAVLLMIGVIFALL